MNVTLLRPWDFHFHPRRGLIMTNVLPFTTRIFAGGVPMPNPKPEILSGHDWQVYLPELQKAGDNPDFRLIGSMKVIDNTTPDMINEAVKCGVEVFKFYPVGTTTGSQTGVSNFYAIFRILHRIHELGKIASFHCELPDIHRRQAEVMFIPTLQDIVDAFPGLRVIVEHASTKDMIEFVQSCPLNVVATLTPQHMWHTYEDVIAEDDITLIDPNNYCKPICNSYADRSAVIMAAISGDPHFFFGSDSAPHYLTMKKGTEVSDVAAGVFNAPVALPVVLQVFETHHALDKLNPFLSVNGLNFYHMKPTPGKLTMIKKSWQVPYEHGGIGLWLGGQTLNWQVGPIT